jgi:hypothetical protein
LLKDGKELARHLSRNQALHVYSETTEELLITILRNIQDEYDKSGVIAARKRLEYELTQPDRSKNTRLTRVLNMDRLILCLVDDLLPLGKHFRDRNEFQASWLAKHIDVIMGVRVFPFIGTFEFSD